MLPMIASIVSGLISNGLPKVADAVIEKGVDYVQDKLGVELKPEGEATPEYNAKLQEEANRHAEFLAELDLQTRAGRACAPDFLAELLIDRWMPCFIQLITSEEQTLTQHKAVLLAQFEPLIGLIFTDACVERPRRKGASA